MIELSPKKRAVGATMIFILFGGIGAWLSFDVWQSAWPLILFYAMLLWNDYFSIIHFSKIIPPEKESQVVIDAMLVFLHLLLALSFNNPERFAVVMTILFIVATLKYASDLPHIQTPHLLYRKIKIDALGALISSFAIAGILLEYEQAAVMVWTAIFAIATIYVILVNPLYKSTLGTS